MKIVIVDDDEAMRNLLRAICEGEGHQVVAQYADGSGLLDFVRSEHPDVVCLDYELPGKNGFELLSEMDVTANHVAVVMISGSSEPELKGHAADLGAAGFIEKPFQEARIVDELKQIEKARTIATRAASMPAEALTPAPGTPAADENTSAAAPTAAPLEASGVVPRSAVIVDDSGAIRLLLKGVLQEIGIKVSGLATNAEEGIATIRRCRPALVCLDVNMPGMSGLEALPQIHEACPQTKIVIVTGNASREVVQAAIAGGAIGYFLKPIRPAKVEEFMRKLLQR
jgi:DNA-binding NarL/FixJ family response regulator